MTTRRKRQCAFMYCDVVFKPRKPNHTYCSERCRKAAHEVRKEATYTFFENAAKANGVAVDKVWLVCERMGMVKLQAVLHKAGLRYIENEGGWR